MSSTTLLVGRSYLLAIEGSGTVNDCTIVPICSGCAVARASIFQGIRSRQERESGFELNLPPDDLRRAVGGQRELQLARFALRIVTLRRCP